MDQWQVNLPNAHPGYIAWEDYLRHQQMLAQNRAVEPGEVAAAAREGTALLQGLLVCGRCGRRLSPRYVVGTRGAVPWYECNWRRRELAGKGCCSMRGDLLDEAVALRIVSALVPAQVEVALSAMVQIEQRDHALEHQWQLKLQRAEYDAQLAQRRFEEVDPANRLVAASLEGRWEGALRELEVIRQQYQQAQQQRTPPLSAEQQAQVRQLAVDLPQLWQDAATTAKDRKRILRQLLKDITVEKKSETHQAILHLRWQGGATEDLTVPMPLKAADRWRYPEDLLNQVRQRAEQQTDQQIAQALHQLGLRSPKGNTFTAKMIAWVRHKHRMPCQPSPSPQAGELTVRQLGQKLAVSQHVVHYWLGKGLITARRSRPGGPLWITLTQEQERRLRDWIATSERLPKPAEPKVLNQIVSGAL
jgi:hypothetical protein